MVEENAAVQVHRMVESTNGLSSEWGLWGNTLRKLKDDGYTENEIAAHLGAVHGEPVLTAHLTG